jgi:hypothetical protein
MAGITDKEVRSLLSKAKNEGKKLTQVDGTIPGLTLVATTTGGFCRVNVASMPCGVSFPDCTSPGRN